LEDVSKQDSTARDGINHAGGREDLMYIVYFKKIENTETLGRELFGGGSHRYLIRKSFGGELHSFLFLFFNSFKYGGE
jgi:hypothetical protein